MRVVVNRLRADAVVMEIRAAQDEAVAEFQVRVAVLNGYTALGIPVTRVVG